MKMAMEMAVDLHVHTSRSSRCSSLTPEEMIAGAPALGLDAVAVTEHGTHDGARLASRLGLEAGFTVFRGIEVCTPEGDMIVFGSEADFGPELAFRKLLELVEADGGLVIAVHPMRGYWGHHRKYKGFPSREALRQVHAIEVLNGGCSRQQNDLAAEIASRLGLPGVGGSDAHSLPELGSCVTFLPEPARGEKELVEMIRAGWCRPAYRTMGGGKAAAEEAETAG